MSLSLKCQNRTDVLLDRNIDKHSLAIIDELGRGTSSRDGLAIALSIAEALVESKALVFFATHFIELGTSNRILHRACANLS